MPLCKYLASLPAFSVIDVKKAMENGIKFYESDNGVILSPGLGEKGIIFPEYFSKVEFSNN